MDSRTRLITTAVTLLAEEGVEAVTLRRIARAAGLSHGAPLRHFAGRAALLTAVAAQGFAELHQVDLPDADPRERLLTACRRYLDFALDHPAMYELMFRRDLTDARELARQHDEVHRWFTGLVTQAHAGEDPRALAASLWAALHGLAELSLRGGLGGDVGTPLEVTLHAYLGQPSTGTVVS